MRAWGKGSAPGSYCYSLKISQRVGDGRRRGATIDDRDTGIKIDRAAAEPCRSRRNPAGLIDKDAHGSGWSRGGNKGLADDDAVLRDAEDGDAVWGIA